MSITVVPNPADQAGHPHRWSMLAVAAFLLAVLLMLARFWPPTSAVPLQTVNVTQWNALPNLQTHLHALDDPRELEIRLPDRFLVFGNWPGRAVRSLELEITPLSPYALDRTLLFYIENGSNWLSFIAQDPSLLGESGAFEPLTEGDSDIRRRVQRAHVTWENGRASLRFHLREPAVWLKLVFPQECRVRLESLRVHLENRDAPEGQARWYPLLVQLACLGLAGWLILLIAAQLWPGVRTINLKRVLIGVQGMLLALTALLLPPFQGPDENRHWLAAMVYFRPTHALAVQNRVAGEEQTMVVPREMILGQLPELLDALRPRWKVDQPFHPAVLRRPGEPIEFQKEGGAGYANPLTYLFVGLVAAWFPTVSTLPEALCLFYLCRMLPIFFWVGLLLYAERRGWLTFTLLTLLSLPLWLQQAVVVSSDTVALLGALAACLLFVVCRKEGGWRPQAALWAVTLVAFAAKPPLALPLLPLFAFPWRKLPVKWLTIPWAILTAGAIGWYGLHFGIALIEKSRHELEGKLQGRLQRVLDGRATKTFLDQVEHRFNYDRVEAAREFYQPLGWLDTPLADWHHVLIAAALVLALLADAVERWRSWYRAARDYWGQLLALWALVVAHALALVLGMCLIMYVTHTATEIGETRMAGVQMRYFFPALIIACIVPFGIRPRAGNSPAPAPRGPVVNLLPCIILTLTLARGVALTLDLLFRYYG
jgi:hypothetical protein